MQSMVEGIASSFLPSFSPKKIEENKAATRGRNQYQCNIEGLCYAQVSAGKSHTVLIRNDGSAVACGGEDPEHAEQCNIPALDEGLHYVQVSAGRSHTVLIRSDGSAVACGGEHAEQCNIPALDEGLRYSQVSAGRFHTVLIRNDGSAVACGGEDPTYAELCNIPALDTDICYTQCSAGRMVLHSSWFSILPKSPLVNFMFPGSLSIQGRLHMIRNGESALDRGETGECDLPPLEEGMTYTQAAASIHTVLLRSDGSAVACGVNDWGQCDIPALNEGLRYTQVSAGGVHTVLLQSDGKALACGGNRFGQCNIPALDKGLSYTQISAGETHTVLLRSDGKALACGGNRFGQCNIPALDEGLSYTQVSAGLHHTVLLRSDGRAVACGENGCGECSIPSLESTESSWHDPCTLFAPARLSTHLHRQLTWISANPIAAFVDELGEVLSVESTDTDVDVEAVRARVCRRFRTCKF